VHWDLIDREIAFLWASGLPAMQATWCFSETKAMQSQASQLPHLNAIA
jgi:hypothetical protein